MRKTITIYTALLLVSLLTTSVTAAWWDREANPNEEKRINTLPDQEFLRGRVHCDTHGEWYLGQTRLEFADEATFTDGKGGVWRLDPRDEKRMLLMGYPIDDGFVVRNGKVLTTDIHQTRSPNHDKIKWSESDPDVGEGVGRIPM